MWEHLEFTKTKGNEAEGAAWSRFVPVGTRISKQETWGTPAEFHDRAVALAWALSGLVPGSNPGMPRGHPGGLRSSVCQRFPRLRFQL